MVAVHQLYVTTFHLSYAPAQNYTEVIIVKYLIFAFKTLVKIVVSVYLIILSPLAIFVNVLVGLLDPCVRLQFQYVNGCFPVKMEVPAII